MRKFTVLILLCLPGQAETAAGIREMVRKSLSGLNTADERRDRFLFKGRDERKEFDSSGKLRSQRSSFWERIEIEGHLFGRVLERDGKALTEAERKQQEEAIQKRLAELKSPTTQAASLSGAPRRNSDTQEMLKELPDALDFQVVGEEAVNGRTATVLAAEPRPSYRAKSMKARVFEKMKGKLWIDKASSELARVEAEMFDTVNVGLGLLGRIEKGTRFELQRKAVGEDVWFTERQLIRFAARVLLVKSIQQENTLHLFDFKPRASAPQPPPRRPASP